jgi:mannose-6-phosphate isomerase
MIYELIPHISRRPWGGRKLNALKQIAIETNAEPIGETWEVSTHKDGTSILKASKQSLSEICSLSYLIKFLDTREELSIQVHPGDEYSKRHENQKGKCECWLILETGESAGIYLGLKPNITKDLIHQAINKKDNVSELLNYIPVSPGDFFYVPPGTIHSIGKNVTLLEIQQSSGVTYRFWDWNRVDQLGKSRELHLVDAMNVLIDDPQKNAISFLKTQTNLFANGLVEKNLINHEDFNVNYYSGLKNNSKKIDLDIKDQVSIIVLKGEIAINSKKLDTNESYLILNEPLINIEFLSDAKFILVK